MTALINWTDDHTRGRGRKRAQALGAVVLALCLVGIAIAAASRQAERARLNGDAAARRMLALTAAYQGPCTLEERPTLLEETPPAAVRSGLHAHVWQGIVHADGCYLELVLNDRTGNLVYMFHGGDAEPTTDGAHHRAGVETAAQAARLSLNSVRQLEMVPRHAQVALAALPRLDRRSQVWHVNWRVRRGDGTRQYLLRVGLMMRDGQILFARNEAELTDRATGYSAHGTVTARTL